MCTKDSINKTCWKNGKDLSNGAPKIKLWNHSKKTHFPVFAKNFRRPWMKLKIFFANFQILGPLGCQGWVVIPQIVKKSQNHCTLPHIFNFFMISMAQDFYRRGTPIFRKPPILVLLAERWVSLLWSFIWRYAVCGLCCNIKEWFDVFQYLSIKILSLFCLLDVFQSFISTSLYYIFVN
jgi:hypothetical protein